MGNLGNIQSLNPHGRLGGLTNLQYPFTKKTTPVSLDTLYVSSARGNDANAGNSPLKPKQTISNAVTSASPAVKNIFVAEGSYPEQVAINKDIAVVGSYSEDFTHASFIDHKSTIAPTGIRTGACVTFDGFVTNACMFTGFETQSGGSGATASSYINIKVYQGAPIIIYNDIISLTGTNLAGAESLIDMYDSDTNADDIKIYANTLKFDGYRSYNNAYTHYAIKTGTGAFSDLIIRNNLIVLQCTSDYTINEMYGISISSTITNPKVQNNTIIGIDNGFAWPIYWAFQNGSTTMTAQNNIATGYRRWGIYSDSHTLYEYNDNYGWEQTTHYPAGNLAINPYLDSGTNIGRFTAFSEGQWAGVNSAITCVHTINGVEYIYQIGGTVTGGTRTDTIWRKSATTPWEYVGVFPIAIGAGRAISFGGKIWVIGGINSAGTILKKVYSSVTGASWTEYAGTINWGARYSHGVFVLNNKLWITGGVSSDGSTSLQDTWGFDGTDWDSSETSLTNKYSVRFGFICSVVNIGGTDKVIISHGHDVNTNYKNDCFSWDGVAAGWTSESTTNTPSARGYVTACVCDNKIYFAGSYNAGGALHDVQELDCSTFTWTEKAATPEYSNRYANGLETLDNVMNNFGGYDTGRISDTWENTPSVNSTWVQTYVYTDGHAQSGTPPLISMGGKDLSAEFTTDRDGNARTTPWAMGCYNRP